MTAKPTAMQVFTGAVQWLLGLSIVMAGVMFVVALTALMLRLVYVAARWGWSLL